MATLPNPRTWTVGELLTAAKLNTDLRDGLNFLLSPPLAVLRLSADITISNNSVTGVSWNSEAIDRDGGHDNVTNPTRYTAQTAGWYDVGIAIAWFTNTTGQRQIIIGGNVSAGLAGNVAPGSASGTLTYMSAARTHFLNVGDYVYAEVWQNSGGSLNIWSNPGALTQLSAKWVSKA